MQTVFLTGMATSAGLIMAIGAQNTYLLTQSVRKNHHVQIALLCAFLEIVLIFSGVTGVGSFVNAYPQFTRFMTWGGAAFLFFYGFLSLRSAFSGGAMHLMNKADDSLKKAILTTLAVTLLNPHVYLDTVVVMGGIASHYEPSGRMIFAAGACSASFIWFSLLSFAGVRMAPYFARPATWRVMYLSVCAIMWGLGISLVI